MTHEEIVISNLLRDQIKFREENREIGLVPDDFLPGTTQDAFRFLISRLSLNKSLDVREIYAENPEQLKAFDGYLSGLALFCIWALNRESDGEFKNSARTIKHQAQIRNGAGQLKNLISR